MRVGTEVFLSGFAGAGCLLVGHAAHSDGI
jgi:hypothetical protein